ncbi:MAG TPA: hypothetical protein VF148_12545 [Acidimicrobiia bacterium]
MTLDESEVPVMVELGDDHVRLSASGTEIGEWPSDECRIAHVTDSIYSITAEDETLQFVPNQPSLFAAAVDGNGPNPAPAGRAPAEAEREATATGQREAPPPKPLTMGLFYALCLATAALAVWSLVSLIF